MRFTVPAIILSLCVALAVPSPLPEPDTSDVDFSKIVLEGISYAGSGCTAGSVSFSPKPEWTIFSLGFGQFTVSIGPGIPTSEKRKNCNLNVKLRYPTGYQYAIYRIDFAGYAALDKDVKATHQVDYWFSGQALKKATLKSEFLGSFRDSYNVRATLTPDNWVWSPCNDSTTLNLNTQVFLDNSLSPQGYGTTVATETFGDTLKAVYGAQWRKCP